MAMALFSKTVGGIAGHDIKLPGLLAGFRVIGGDEAARRAPLSAAVADDDLVFEHFRRTRNDQRQLGIESLLGPYFLASPGVDRNQAAIDVAS
jgi:hypothetical protein